MADAGEWIQLAIGDVASEVKAVATRRLLDDFGVQIAEVSDDDIRIDVMQNLDRSFCCASHSVSQPLTQYRQSPQADPSQAMATRSSSWCSVAPGPVRSTMHSPDGSILMRTWPGPGSGIGSSQIISLPPSLGRPRPASSS
jgi:hypothetical protein